MSEPFIGEIRFFPYVQFTPVWWLPCDGSSYQVSQYQVLYAVIGAQFGGTLGKSFCVPDMRGQAAVGVDATGIRCPGSSKVGVTFGTSAVTLNTTNTPSHSHALQRNKPLDGYNSQTSAPAINSDLGGLATSKATPLAIFTTGAAPNSILADGTINTYGAINPASHENRQPFLVMRAAIAWDGVFPVPAD
jgi:microcystin-dependent protein